MKPNVILRHLVNTILMPPSKLCFYRGRLARLTGLEQPKAQHSSYWGERFVPVRETARALPLAIEDTMQILFGSSSTDPVSLLQPWQQAFRIFWTLRCSFHDRPEAPGPYGDIQVSLRRDIDGNVVPKRPWKADQSEIEAVLGLWSWSLKSLGILQLFACRILSAHRDMKCARRESLHLETWREVKSASEIQEQLLEVDVSDIAAMEHGGGFFVKSRKGKQENQPTLRCIQNQNVYGWNSAGMSSWQRMWKAPSKLPRDGGTQLFGWCNVTAEKVSPGNKLAVLLIDSTNSILLNCAQEIYSTFLAAITQTVEHIGTSSAVKHQGTLTGKASNGNVKRIQQALIARGLCDEDAAFACTIPVLQRQGKLKLPDELLDIAGEVVDEHRSKAQ